MYVAATRAKDRLLIPFFTAPDAKRSGDGAPSLNDHLRASGADEGNGIEAEGLPALEQETPVWRRPRKNVPIAPAT
jgi:ATP-dependent exoDNAse (exonuclease V) beta subunit